ncbi:uncharacterized protein DEA37_0014476 [Paragonimus westermani]|uniref:Uncharacterized protein n=1 Tax=Paragonimus westermani TaxID=34504 RepID=A0A5J4NLL1_9TREM|nr:uncharacterized protein DEA37_0014476 [Paragonimus westermani]
MVVCASHTENGQMVVDYVVGCELYCPKLGQLVCNKDEIGRLSWSPVDPCRLTTTTTTTTTAVTITTTEGTTTTEASRTSNSTTVSMMNHTNSSTEAANQGNETTHTTHDYFNSTSPYTLTKSTTIQQHTGETFNSIPRWVMSWLIPILAFIAVTLSLLICCIAVHHLRKHRGQIYLRKKNRQYDTVLRDAMGSPNNSGSQSHTVSSTNSVTALTQATREWNGSNELRQSNGAVMPKKAIKMQRRLSHRKRKAKVDTMDDHRFVNWQEMDTHSFITPPSPRSAVESAGSMRKRNGDVLHSNNPYAPLVSTDAPSSITLRHLANVTPLPRAPSPLASQFGEVQSLSHSSAYGSAALYENPMAMALSALEDAPDCYGIQTRHGFPQHDPLLVDTSENTVWTSDYSLNNKWPPLSENSPTDNRAGADSQVEMNQSAFSLSNRHLYRPPECIHPDTNPPKIPRI